MKTLNRLFFLVALLLSAWTITGCTKEAESGPTTVAGQVLLRSTRQPVTRAPAVQVWGRAGGGNAVSGSTRAYAPVGPAQPTDAQGQFSFSFEAEAGSDYVLQLASGNTDYYTGITQAPTLRGGRKNEGVAFFVDAFGWVRLNFVDEPPRTSANIYSWGWGGGGVTLYSPKDTALVVPYIAGRPETVLWEIHDGQVNRYSRDFTLAPFDTLRIRIPY